MSKIEQFEDIESWQKARRLAREIYIVSGNGNFDKGFALRGQIRKSAISVVSNIAEGFARQTNKEFVQFLYISHGSLAEIQAQLYIALDVDYINVEKFNLLYGLCCEVSKMVMGMIKYLKTYEIATLKTDKS